MVGNCAWCALGLVHLAGGSATIETRIGAIDDHVIIRIENGRLLDTDYVVHFPIPMKHAWDNVIYTCSVQLLFRDEAQVDEWCASRGIPKGTCVLSSRSGTLPLNGMHAMPMQTGPSGRYGKRLNYSHAII